MMPTIREVLAMETALSECFGGPIIILLERSPVSRCIRTFAICKRCKRRLARAEPPEGFDPAHVAGYLAGKINRRDLCPCGWSCNDNALPSIVQQSPQWSPYP